MKKVLILLCILFLSFATIAQTPDLYPKKNSLGKYGFYNRSGTLKISHKYADALAFNDGLAAVKYGTKWGYIDESGTTIVAFTYDLAWYFTEGLAAVKKNGKWGYIDKEGNTEIDFIYDNAGDFSGGIAWASKNGLFGYITKTGATKVDFKYKAANSFEDGLAAVKKGSLWGFINETGSVVIDFKFDDAGHFDKGLCPVKKYDKWGYIDTRGELVVDYSYTTAKDDYRDLDFGWKYAAGAYKLAEASKKSGINHEENLEHLQEAVTLIKYKKTYLYSSDCEKLIPYYKMLGDKENLKSCKSKTKSSKSRGGLDIDFDMWPDDGIDLAFGTNALKAAMYKRYNQIPMYAELRLGENFAMRARYNIYDGFEDKWRFGAWLDNEWSFKYSGQDYGMTFKFLDGDVDDDFRGQGFMGNYYGLELRYGQFTFDSTYTMDLDRKSDYSTIFDQSFRPEITTYEINYNYGWSYTRGLLYIDFYTTIGFGYRDYKFGEFTHEEYEFSDEHFSEEIWFKFYMPMRVNLIVGITLF